MFRAHAQFAGVELKSTFLVAEGDPNFSGKFFTILLFSTGPGVGLNLRMLSSFYGAINEWSF